MSIASAVPLSGKASRTVTIRHLFPSSRTAQRREPDVNDGLSVCREVAGIDSDRAIDKLADGDATTTKTTARLRTRSDAKRH